MAKVISQLPSGGSVPKHNNLLGLNEGDYLHLTQFEKAKLDGIQSGAEVNVNADWNAISGDAQLLNKPTSFPPSTHTHTISEVINLQNELNSKENISNKVNTISSNSSIDYPTEKAVVEYVSSELNLSKNPDRITENTGFTLVGQDITMNSLWKGVISGVEYSNPTSQVINLPLSTVANTRADIIVLTKNNNFIRVQGVESTTNPPIPSVPNDTLLAVTVIVNDSSIGNITNPISGDEYVKKIEFGNVLLTGSGVINQLNLVDEKATIVFKGSITRLNTISYASVPYNGKRITLFNAQATPVTIGHSVSGYGVDFVFANGQDYVLVPNETIEFSFDITYAPYAHHMPIGGKTDVSGKKNKTLAVTTVPGITKTLADTDECIVFTNTNAVTFTIPTNASVPIPVGTKVRYTQQGTGAVTVGGTGITFVTNLPLTTTAGETRVLTKIDTNTWALEGGSDMATNVAQNVTALKTFLNGMLGLRNVANTITSFFSNSNTAARTYTLQNRNGTLADDTDLAGKMNVPSGIPDFLSKFLTPTTIGVSRLRDTGYFFGIGTTYSPGKDITLGNQNNKDIGIEESNANTVGRDLTISAGRTNDYLLTSLFTAIGTGFVSNSITISQGGDIYVLRNDGNILKKTGGIGAFVATNPNITSFINIAIHPNGNMYGVRDGTGTTVYMQIGGSGNFNGIQGINFLKGICIAPNGDVYVCSWFNGDIYKQTGGIGAFVATGQTARSWDSLCATPTGDIYATVANGDIYKQTGGIGAFVATGQPFRNWKGITSVPNGNVYTVVNGGDVYMQAGGTGGFNPTGQVSRSWLGIAAIPSGNIYATADDLYFLDLSAKGAPNLNGGAFKAKAGTGKGTGKSRVEFYTGQKRASGTDMQIETLREYIDENGYHVYMSMPIFADNAAAIAGGLPVGCEYRTATGVKMIVY